MSVLKFSQQPVVTVPSRNDDLLVNVSGSGAYTTSRVSIANFHDNAGLNFSGFSNDVWGALRKADQSKYNHANRKAWSGITNKIVTGHDCSIIIGGFGYVSFQGDVFSSSAGQRGFYQKTVEQLLSMYPLKGVDMYSYPIVQTIGSGNYTYNQELTYWFMENFGISSGGGLTVDPDPAAGASLPYVTRLSANEFYIDFLASSGSRTGNFGVAQSFYSGGSWQAYASVAGLTNVSATSSGTNQYYTGVSWTNATPFPTRIQITGFNNANGISIFNVMSRNNTISGITVSHYVHGSASYNDVQTTGGIRDTVRSGVWGHERPDLFLWVGGDGNSSQTSKIYGFVNLIKTLLPSCAFVGIGTYPLPAIDSTVANDSTLRSGCISGGYAYMDLYSYFVDSGTFAARGFGYTAGPHPLLSGTVVCDDFIADFLNITSAG